MGKNFKVDFSGLKKLQKNMENFSKTSNNVPLNQLFTNDFMRKNTNFTNSDDFFNACNIHTDEDLKQIPDSEIDKFVSLYTKFSSWQEMLNASAVEYTKNKLDL